MHDETIVIHRVRKPGFQISNLDLKIKDGIVDSFSIFDSNSLRNQDGNLTAKGIDSKIIYTYVGAVTHEEHVGVCFSFNDPKGNDISVLMDGKCLSLSEVPPKMVLRESFDQTSDINLIIDLWVDAITTPNIIASFIHLWQIIEFITKRCGPQELLISEDHINLVEKLLVEKGYDKEIVKGRISNLIKGLPSSSFVEQAKEGIKQVFAGIEIPENFDDVIRKARKFRGKYVHPQSNIEPHSDSFYECYNCLREMIKDVLNSAKQNFV